MKYFSLVFSILTVVNSCSCWAFDMKDCGTKNWVGVFPTDQSQFKKAISKLSRPEMLNIAIMESFKPIGSKSMAPLLWQDLALTEKDLKLRSYYFSLKFESLKRMGKAKEDPQQMADAEVKENLFNRPLVYLSETSLSKSGLCEHLKSEVE